MAFIQKDNGGTLFPNKEKKGMSSPDYRGTIRINGVEYYMSAWNKRGTTGPYLSLAFTVKTSNTKNYGSVQRQLDDEIPF